MRIAYVLTSLGVGGAEKQVIALAERMKSRGHEVLVVVLLARQAEEWATLLDVIHLDLQKTPASLCAGFAKLYRSLRGFHPNLIHSHTFPANMAARLYRLSSRRAPVISTIHNVYEGGWWRMKAYRFSDGLSRVMTAVSQAASERYVRLKAVPAGKMRVVTNGIDTAEFAPDIARRARIREEMGFGDEFVWMAVGRLVPAKDYPNLLRGFARARVKFPATQLIIAGEITGSAAQSVQSLAIELGLHEYVRWLGLRRDMTALLDASDGFVLASAWEGMPLVVGEAMAMEKPVVSTDVGGVRELVGECASVVPAKDSEALAEAMLSTIRTTLEARASLGGRARRRIQDQFNIDKKADEWEVLYQTILGCEVSLGAAVSSTVFYGR
jgi:glycosyltransferase involved in cell wall biosynthesis